MSRLMARKPFLTLLHIFLVLLFLLSTGAVSFPVNAQQPQDAVTANPALDPPYTADCVNAWYRVTGGLYFGYLTLNVDNEDDSTNAAVWTPNIPSAGTYRLEAYIPTRPVNLPCFNEPLTTDARYAIFPTGGDTPVIVSVDQSAATSQSPWVTMGDFDLPAGTTARIEMTDLNGEENLTHAILFGAIRLINLDDLTETIYLPFTSNEQAEVVFVTSAATKDSASVIRSIFTPGDSITFHAGGTNLRSRITPATITFTITGPCGVTTIFSGLVDLPAFTWSYEKSATAPSCPGAYTFRASADYGGFSSNLTSAFLVTTTNQFFDKCEVSTTANMQKWWNSSPYYYTNIYIGGSRRACDNDLLTPLWVSTVAAQGWGFVPTWVGPQAPCYPRGGDVFSYTPSVAYEQGRDEAAAAVLAANALGFTGNVPIYYDIEGFRPATTTCRNAVKSFLTGWTTRIHELGYISGAYGGSYGSYVSDWWDITPRPDEVWLARWYPNPQLFRADATLYGDPYVSDEFWNGHRLRQYAGDHKETWGSVQFTIDSNATDGLIADLPPGLAAMAAPAATPERIVDFQLVSSRQGWVTLPSRLLWTTDAGSSWRDITPPLVDQASIQTGYFLDASTGWLAVESQGLQVLRTTDSGASWQSAPLPPLEDGGTVKSLGFSDEFNGWLEVQLASSSNFSYAVLYRSFDGGATWTQFDLPAAGEIVFTGALNGWLAGGPSGSDLYRTTSAGHSWQLVALPAADAGEARVSLPSFADDLSGMTAVTYDQPENPRVELFSTHDGGASWTRSATLPLETAQDAPAWLALSGSNRWLTALPEEGKLFSSGGRAATAVSAGDLPEGIIEMSFRQAAGWALSFQGLCTGVKGTPSFFCSAQPVLSQTSDGGSTWTDITAAIPAADE